MRRIEYCKVLDFSLQETTISDIESKINELINNNVYQLLGAPITTGAYNSRLLVTLVKYSSYEVKYL